MKSEQKWEGGKGYPKLWGGGENKKSKKINGRHILEAPTGSEIHVLRGNSLFLHIRYRF